MKKYILTACTAFLSSLVVAKNTPIFPSRDTGSSSRVEVAETADTLRTIREPVLDSIPVEYWGGNSPEMLDSALSVIRGAGNAEVFEKYFESFRRLDTTVVLTSDTPDSVYQKRLRSILSPIGLPWNNIVKQHIITYTTKGRTLMGNVLSRSQFYFPLVEQELSNAGLPLELRMLPVVESAYVPTARSKAGAAGLWQFMYATGKEYGLEITTFVDQRLDPVASTRAACRYLAFLNRLYDDWTLALAAYNCGPGNVNKALKRAGANARTYWDIYPFLPAETRDYVPLFVAATYAYNFHEQHGIEIAQPTLPVAVDTMTVSRLMHIDQIATTLDVPLEILRALNPQYIKDIVPALDKSYSIVLPQSHLTHFIGREEDIHRKDSVYLAQYLDPANIDETRAVLTATATIHRVKSGEYLGSIARKYGVRESQIISWNNLKNANKLKIGQRLEIRK